MRALLVVLLSVVLLSCGDDSPEIDTITLTPIPTAVEDMATPTSEALTPEPIAPTPTPTRTVVQEIATATSVAPTPEQLPPTATPSPTPTGPEKIATATRIAQIKELFFASEECKLARERLAGTDFVKIESEEQGRPTWEERFLDVDVVVRAKLVSSHPRIASIRNSNDDGERHYPAIEMIFRAFEAFRGSVSLDYIVVWQVGWDYYGSYPDAECVRSESIANLRQDYRAIASKRNA